MVVVASFACGGLVSCRKFGNTAALIESPSVRTLPPHRCLPEENSVRLSQLGPPDRNVARIIETTSRLEERSG